jgi:Na+/H+-dicarboxylate symporter
MKVALHWQILIGLVGAFVFAFVCRAVFLIEPPAAMTTVDLGTLRDMVATSAARAEGIVVLDSIRQPFAFVGQLFLRLLKLIVLPLIIVSVISGIQGIGSPDKLGKIGLRTFAYYVGTSFVAVVTGLLVVNVIRPGEGLGLTVPGEAELEPKPLLDVFRDIVPSNFFEALSNGDMLPVIFASVVFGLALLLSGKAGEPVREVIDGLNVVIFKLTDWIMKTAPVGVAALLVDTLLDPKLADLTSFFVNLGGYSLSVLLGLFVHGLVVLPLVLLFVAKRNPADYIRSLSPALLTAFSTASSSATYPVTRDCVVDDAGVSRDSADFVLPLGATINMDGTALYEAVAAVFIANAIGIDLTFAQQVVIVITATLAAIGAAGVPSAGLVTMIIVLESVGLPAGGYALVVAVDRILDMCRTTINVWGDSVGAAVVDRLSADT